MTRKTYQCFGRAAIWFRLSRSSGSAGKGGGFPHCELLLSRSHFVAQHIEPRKGHKLGAVDQGPSPDGAGFVE